MVCFSSTIYVVCFLGMIFMYFFALLCLVIRVFLFSFVYFFVTCEI